MIDQSTYQLFTMYYQLCIAVINQPTYQLCASRLINLPTSYVQRDRSICLPAAYSASVLIVKSGCGKRVFSECSQWLAV